MRFLHISDLHFRAPQCLDRPRDPDHMTRAALIYSVRERIAEFGAIDVILVTGDIAFCGSPDEYQAAEHWLQELANVAGCAYEDIYVVPGNHDVDREKIRTTQSIRNAHAAMLQSANIDRAVNEQLRDRDTERALLSPLDAYNAFACRFECSVLPGKWSWIHDIPLSDDVFVRLRGITSTFLSGAVRENSLQDDTRESLYIGADQYVLATDENIVNLVLSHHPPGWLRNYRDIERVVENHGHLQFFGHEHERRAHATQTFVRMFASAVNPERSDAVAPGYNLVNLELFGSGRDRRLEINFMELEWQNNPPRFRPVTYGRDDEKVYRHTLPFPGSGAKHQPIRIEPVAAPLSPAIATVEAPMTKPTWRNLNMRFWRFGVQERHDILAAMGLVDLSEDSLPELERCTRALERAFDRKMLEQLEVEIKGREQG